MPSIHIPEAVFAKYIEQTGDYQEAKKQIKRVVQEGVTDE